MGHTETNGADLAPRVAYLAQGDRLATVNVPPPVEDETKWQKPRSWKGYIWDSFDKPQDERWLIFKLDVTLLTVACAGVFIRQLDQSNINNAFVSGMCICFLKESLGLYGNELNVMNTCFQVGYAVGQIPLTMLITKVPPHIFLCVLEVSWAILTFGASGVTKAGHLYLIRFLVGLLEGGYFPCVMWICGSWYNRSELAKRTVLIQVASTAGGMFSGYFQTAAYNGLNGRAGRPGWKWGFILDGVVSLPIGLLAYFLAPDVPAVAKPNWVFKPEEIALAKARKPLEAYERPDNFSRKNVTGYLTTWQFWLFSLLFICTGSCSNPKDSMAFWFKSYNKSGKYDVYSVAQINNYPTVIPAIQMFYSLVSAWSSDSWLKGRRYPPILLASTLVFAVDISLGALPVHGNHHEKITRWALYYFTSLVTGTTGIIWGWVQETCGGDSGKRAFVGASMNMFSVAFQAWVPNVLFPTWDQPYVVKGNFGTAGFNAAAFLITCLIWYAQSRDEKRVQHVKDVENSSNGAARIPDEVAYEEEK